VPKPETTKLLMSNALKKLATTKHIDKISINEIVEEASLNRQTFYYHFLDKQELICWTYDADTSKLMIGKDATQLSAVIEYIYSEKEFYRSAFTSEAQNGLREHFYKKCYTNCTKEVQAVLGNRKMKEGTLLQLAHFFAHAVTDCMVNWARTGTDDHLPQLLREHEMFVSALIKYSVDYCVEQDSQVVHKNAIGNSYDLSEDVALASQF